MEALESYSEAGLLPSLGHLQLYDLGHSISFLCASVCELYGMGIIYLFYSAGMIDHVKCLEELPVPSVVILGVMRKHHIVFEGFEQKNYIICLRV